MMLKFNYSCVLVIILSYDEAPAKKMLYELKLLKDVAKHKL